MEVDRATKRERIMRSAAGRQLGAGAVHVSELAVKLLPQPVDHAAVDRVRNVAEPGEIEEISAVPASKHTQQDAKTCHARVAGVAAGPGAGPHFRSSWPSEPALTSRSCGLTISCGNRPMNGSAGTPLRAPPPVLAAAAFAAHAHASCARRRMPARAGSSGQL